MTPRDRVLSIRLDPDVADAMDALREQHGTPFSVQVRRALRAWLIEQGALVEEPKKSPRPRASTRKRG